MKIGVMIPLKADTDVLTEFKKAKDMQLDSCQISIWDMSLYTDDNAAAICAAAQQTGLEISTLWAGWSGPKEWNFSFGPVTLGLVPAAYRGTRLHDLEKAVDFAEKIHVANIATHVGFLPENPRDPDYIGTIGALRHLCRMMKEKNQTFLFETGQETPVTILRAIEDIGYDNVGINFDTANLILYGKANSADAVRIFGKYIRDTHIKDGLFPTNGSALGKEVPVGQGRADFPVILEELKKCGYTGPFTIEREIRGEQQTRDIIAARALLMRLKDELAL